MLHCMWQTNVTRKKKKTKPESLSVKLKSFVLFIVASSFVDVTHCCHNHVVTLKFIPLKDTEEKKLIPNSALYHFDIFGIFKA